MESRRQLFHRIPLFASFVAPLVGRARPADTFLVQPGKVGPLTSGMRILDIWKFYPRQSIKGAFTFPEGVPTPVIEIRIPGSPADPALTITLNGDHRQTVIQGIGVSDPRFKTAAGIGPGSTIDSLRRNLHDLSIGQYEQYLFLFSQRQKMSFDVDDNPGLYGANGQFKPVSDWPGSIRIGSIWVK